MNSKNFAFIMDAINKRVPLLAKEAESSIFSLTKSGELTHDCEYDFVYIKILWNDGVPSIEFLHLDKFLEKNQGKKFIAIPNTVESTYIVLRIFDLESVLQGMIRQGWQRIEAQADLMRAREVFEEYGPGLCPYVFSSYDDDYDDLDDFIRLGVSYSQQCFYLENVFKWTKQAIACLPNISRRERADFYEKWGVTVVKELPVSVSEGRFYSYHTDCMVEILRGSAEISERYGVSTSTQWSTTYSVDSASQDAIIFLMEREAHGNGHSVKLLAVDPEVAR